MTKRTKKIVGYLFLLLAVGGVSAGYYLWNKPHRSVADAKSVEVAAAVLHTAYLSDSATANKTYTDKVVEVSGQVSKVSVNQQKQVIVLLQTAQEGAFVNCTMEGADPGAKEGAAIRLKGICSGYNGGDADLGLPGDVVLVRCYLSN